MTSVHIERLRKSYASLEVLKGINLEINAGEFVALLGPSGCGKSTLLHSIAGLETITDGRILIGGDDVTRREPKDRGIAMVFQSYALYPTMTVRQNMGFALRIAGWSKAETGRKVDEAAAMLQLKDYLDRRPAELSGGQRQRVAIGRALVRDVSVFLFDEPLSNLDAKLRTEMRLELKKLHSELGATMIYVTHDQVEAMTMADRIALLKAGEIVQVDPPERLYERPCNLFAASFIGSPEINLLRGRFINGCFEAHGLSVHHPSDHGTPDTDADIVLGIRPEDLSWSLEAEADLSMPATLTLVEPLGSETLAWCDSPAGRVCMRLRPDEAHALPSHFQVVIDPKRASFFSARSGERIQAGAMT